MERVRGSAAVGSGAAALGSARSRPFRPWIEHALRHAVAVIELDGVRKVYRQGAREVVALDRVTMRVERGEFLSVMGRSGSGKSTLLHLAGALDLPSEGTVSI